MEEKTNLIDQLIIKCNNSVKDLTHGQYIAFCSQMVEMVRGLAVLRNMIVEGNNHPDEKTEEVSPDA